MKILRILAVFLLFLTFRAEASPYTADPDSAKYKWIKGKKFILHKVHAKETWNSVAGKYQVSIADLMRANLGVIDIKPGQILNVPSEKTEPSMAPQEKAQPVKAQQPVTQPVVKQEAGGEQTTPIHYTVKPGETLYAVSKKFNITVDDLKKWNVVEGDIVKENQRLTVGFMALNTKAADVSNEKAGLQVLPEDKKPVNDFLIENKAQPVTEKRPQVSPQPETKKEENSVIPETPTQVVVPAGKTSTGKKLSQVAETGICSWISDNDVNQSKFYALHRSAPVGTIIKVTNKMNAKHVFVKVVGLLPNTGNNENSIIKISEAAVKKLGALDAHFLVELTYGITQ